jgi:glucokinase
LAARRGEILDAFTRDVRDPFVVDAAAAGVAGPVVGGRARLTNIEWDVSSAEIAARLNTSRVRLLNDLEAMALGTTVLAPDEVVQLQAGMAREDGNAAVIAAGTGLGEAYLHRVDGRLRPVASEGGHADFAARTDREIELVRMLRRIHGRAEVEHVLSGPGLLNLHRLTHDGQDCPAIRGLDETSAPAGVSRAALEGSCRSCAEALSLFVEAYGAAAGNLALRGLATSGIFVGGGIAPRILPALQDGRFIEAFRAKGPMSELASNIPVNVILMPEAGLLGAALSAQELLGDPRQLESTK